MSSRNYDECYSQETYNQWLKSTQLACRHATRRLALAERTIRRLTQDNEAFLIRYERERRLAGLD